VICADPCIARALARTQSGREFIPTPQFPEYTSGHSTVSAASASVLTGLYGAVAFTEATPVQPGFAPRSFPSFMAAAAEAARSRLYGGIHYPMGNDHGSLQGQCVAGHVSQIETRR
jgi:membrane-associated phospholipid phosphatase